MKDVISTSLDSILEGKGYYAIDKLHLEPMDVSSPPHGYKGEPTIPGSFECTASIVRMDDIFNSKSGCTPTVSLLFS